MILLNFDSIKVNSFSDFELSTFFVMEDMLKEFFELIWDLVSGN